jgi:phage gp29-like protein
MSVLVNGERPRLIDPTTGRPFEGYDTGFAQPPVLSYSFLLNQARQIYSAVRRDDAMSFGRMDALAMERDAFIQGLMLERYEATALLKWHIEPEDPKDKVQLADAMWHQKIIERTPNFQRYKMNLLYAIWFGRSAIQQVINRVRGERIMGRPVWRIVDHSPVRGDKIEFTYQLDKYREGMPVIFLNAARANEMEERGATIVHTDYYVGMLLTDGYWRERFVIHKHLTKDYDPFEEPEKQGVIHGFGVRDQIFHLDWIRKEWLANVSDFIDQVGKGGQIYPYDASNPNNEAKAIEAASRQSRNTVIVWPVWPGHGGQMLPTAMSPSMSGSEILIKLMSHMEEHIERCIIGQSGSGRAQNSVMGNPVNSDQMAMTKYNRIRWDAQNLDETLTEDMLGPLHRWNSPGADYKLFFKSEIERPDAEKMIQTAQALYQMNVPIRSHDLRGFAGYSNPEPGDDVVSQTADQEKAMGLQAEIQQAQQQQDDQSAQEEAAKQHAMEMQQAADKHNQAMAQAQDRHGFEMRKAENQLALQQREFDFRSEYQREADRRTQLEAEKEKQAALLFDTNEPPPARTPEEIERMYRDKLEQAIERA